MSWWKKELMGKLEKCYRLRNLNMQEELENKPPEDREAVPEQEEVLEIASLPLLSQRAGQAKRWSSIAW